MSRSTTSLIVAILVLVHGLLAFFYAKETPYRTTGLVNGQVAKDIGAPDERQHANYVDRLMRGEGFPTFDPKDPNLYETYQSHQPPLYYLLAAGYGKAVGATNIETNDAGLRLRLLNVLFGCLAVAGVALLAQWGFRKPEVTVTASVVAALLPMHLALSGAISNDPLLIALCTWSLAFIAKALRGGSMGDVLVASLLAGLALLTKTTALALLPVLLFAAVAVKGKNKTGWVVAGLLLVLAIPGWWWVRNVQLYGDPFALRAFNEAFTGSAQKSMFVENIIPRANPTGNAEMIYWTEWVGSWTARSFVGVFGYMDVWLTDTGFPTGYNGLYMVLLALLGIGVLAWPLSLFGKESKDTGAVQVVNAFFALIVLLLFLRFNMTYFQAQARYLYPAVGPIAVGVALGWTHLVKKRPTVPAGILAALLLGANAFALGKLPGEFEKRIRAASETTSVTPGPNRFV